MASKRRRRSLTMYFFYVNSCLYLRNVTCFNHVQEFGLEHYLLFLLVCCSLILTTHVSLFVQQLVRDQILQESRCSQTHCMYGRLRSSREHSTATELEMRMFRWSLKCHCMQRSISALEQNKKTNNNETTGTTAAVIRRSYQ